MNERTNEEILERIKSVEDNDWLGTQRGDLISYLPWSLAKAFYKDESVKKVDAGEEEYSPYARDRDSVITQIKEYMSFAWDKANNCRGLSAGRSLDHYSAWVWMAGDDLGDLGEYEYYGKDNLIKICELYGIDHAQYDDGIRVNTE